MSAAGRIEMINNLLAFGLVSHEEAVALLNNMTLEEYRASKTKLGTLLRQEEPSE